METLISIISLLGLVLFVIGASKLLNSYAETQDDIKKELGKVLKELKEDKS